MRIGALPKFSRPPVIETVMGVEFSPQSDWSIPHFGLFWATIRDHFPKSEVQPPIVSGVESFESPQMAEPGRIRVELANYTEARCWFLTEDGSELVQVQNDRLIFNWRKRRHDDAYPGYDELVKPRFAECWEAYTRFLASVGIVTPTVLQCELSYVSHIPKGDGWEAVEDWPQVLTALRRPNDATLLREPESAALNVTYVMPSKNGRLRIDAKYALRKMDGMHIIVLNITSRCKPKSSETSALMECFELGHEWVVQGFADTTTAAMHERWGRYQ